VTKRNKHAQGSRGTGGSRGAAPSPSSYRVYLTLTIPKATPGGTGQEVVFRTYREVMAVSQETAIKSQALTCTGRFDWVAEPWLGVYYIAHAMRLYLICPMPGKPHCRVCGSPKGQREAFWCPDCKPPNKFQAVPVSVVPKITPRQKQAKVRKVAATQAEISQASLDLADLFE
jgi:hypothetical protein